MRTDWDSERLNAERVLRSLSEDYLEERNQRLGVQRRWPEVRPQQDESEVFELEKDVPEVLLRDDSEDSFISLQSHVRESVKMLYAAGEDKSVIVQQEERVGTDGEQDMYMEQPDVVTAIENLTDVQVLDAFPSLLVNVKPKVLLEIYALLSGKIGNLMNRKHLVNSSIKKLVHVFPGEPLAGPLPDLLTILRSPETYKRVDIGGIRLDASDTNEAVRSAILQVDQLPLKDLVLMFRVIRGLDPPKVGLVSRSGNKDRLVKGIRKKALGLFAPSAELHPNLRNALMIMSLSARNAFGNDGKLMQFLGPVPSHQEALQNMLLSALSKIKCLKVDNLTSLCNDLAEYCGLVKKGKADALRNKIAAVFLDSLLNSTVREVPVAVKRAAEKVVGMVSYGGRTKVRAMPNDITRRSEVELESVLRVSSHLQQIMSDLIESNAANKNEGVNYRTYASEQTPDSGYTADLCGSGMDANPQIEAKNQIVIWSSDSVPKSFDEDSGNRKFQEDQDILAESKWLHGISQIGDGGAEIAYDIIGSTLEKMIRLRGHELGSSVKNYFKFGAKRKASETGKGVEKQFGKTDEVSIILSLAENDSRISSRTMVNVRRRLLE